MFAFLKNHPFAVEAFFESSLVLTFAVQKEHLQNFIPECLDLDTFEDKWAFIAVAMVQTSALRPKGLPKFLGSDFFLIGYRIFTRYTNSAGKRIRGLYIIRSETNRRKMAFFGNIFTHYNYTSTDISQIKNGGKMEIRSEGSNFEVAVEESNGEILLPPNSPFSTWKEARRFAGPLPFTFTYNPKDKTVLIIEGVRHNWTPEPVNVSRYRIGFLDSLNLEGLVLANAFAVKNIPYYWKSGRIERWQK
jgi:uncharacterized protein YqjF (DUF2071 family)